jgi:hypothetical protein
MWHPRSETEACSDTTALVEWLRATGRWPEAEPEGLQAWLGRHPIGADPELDEFRPLAATPRAADAP